MLYAIIENGKVTNTVVWDGEGDLFIGENAVKAPDGVGIGWTYDGENFLPIEYNENETGNAANLLI
ncbi:hypothetical protein SPM32_23755 [Enterobacter hormaechei subsp. xiangfangensis]